MAFKKSKLEGLGREWGCTREAQEGGYVLMHKGRNFFQWDNRMGEEVLVTVIINNKYTIRPRTYRQLETLLNTH